MNHRNAKLNRIESEPADSNDMGDMDLCSKTSSNVCHICGAHFEDQVRFITHCEKHKVNKLEKIVEEPWITGAKTTEFKIVDLKILTAK